MTLSNADYACLPSGVELSPLSMLFRSKPWFGARVRHLKFAAVTAF